MDEGAARRIARISDGNFNAALLVADGTENGNDKLLHKWLVCCFNLKQKPTAANTQSLVEWVDDFSKAAARIKRYF